MKNIMRSLILLVFTFPSLVHAQTYTFNKSTATYADITGGINFLTDFNDSIILGYNFTISGVSNSRLNVLSRGDMTTGPYSISSLWFYPFGVEIYMGQHSYVITGAAGNRIAKIQFKNAKFAHEPSATSTINYQVWLYESDNSIEVRFGPSHIYDAADCYEGATGPYIGMDNEFWLKGTSAAPTLDIASHYLSGTPANGTVFRFAPVAAAVNSVQAPVFGIFPNPSKGLINIHSPIGSVNEVDVYSLSGKHIAKYSFTGSSTIDLSGQCDGIYLLQFSSDENDFVDKVILQR